MPDQSIETSQGNTVKENPHMVVIKETKEKLKELNIDWDIFLREAMLSEKEVAQAVTKPEAQSAFRLRPDESLDSGRRGAFELERVLSTLYLALDGKVEAMPRNLTNLVSAFTPEVIATFPPNEAPFLKLMLWKLRTITRAPIGEIYTHLDEKWRQTIITSSVPKEIGVGLAEIGDAERAGKKPEEGNAVMSLVRDHWGKFLLVGTAGFALYRLFGGESDEKKEKDGKKGFFEWLFSLIEKVPGGKFSVGTLVLLAGIYGLFGKSITGWFEDDGVIGKIMKFTQDPSLGGLWDIAKTIFGGGEKKEEGAKTAEGGSVLETATVIATGGVTGLIASGAKTVVNGVKRAFSSDTQSEASDDARAEAVGTARIYQAYHGFYLPYKSLSTYQKNIFHNRVATSYEAEGKLSYETAQSRLPQYETRYQAMIASPEKILADAEKKIGEAFEKGNGGNREEGIRAMTDEQKKLVGITDSLPLEERNARYYRYLAVNQVNLEARALEYHMMAIRAGMEAGGTQGGTAYKTVMDRLRNPELYYEELRLLEEVRLNNIDAVTRTGRLSAHGSEIREFLTLRSSLEKLVGEKDAQVGKIVEEIKQEMKKAGYVMAEKGKTLTPQEIAKNQAIDLKLKPKIAQIATIEKEVSRISTRFMKENEGQIVALLEREKTAKSFVHRYFRFIPDINAITQAPWGGKIQAYKSGLVASSITDFQTGRSPQFFRMGSIKGGMIVTGLGAGWAFYNSGKGEGVQNALETGGRIAGGMVPFLAEYLDARDAYDAVKKGEYMNAFIYSAAFVADVASTALFITGFGSLFGVGLKVGTVTAIKSAIKKGATEVVQDGEKLVMKKGEAIVGEVSLSTKEMGKISSMQSWIVKNRDTIRRYATLGLTGGLIASLGGTGVALAGGFLSDAGKLETQDFTLQPDQVSGIEVGGGQHSPANDPEFEIPKSA